MSPRTGPTVRDYLRAVAPALPGAAVLPALRRDGRELPTHRIEVPDVTVDPDHLARYREVCGFTPAGALPVPYPHVLAFASQLRLMSAPDFPFPVVGMVHVANSITVHRPLPVDAHLTIAVSAQNLRPHPRGQQLDVVSTVSWDGSVAWEDTSTYLRRGPGGTPDAERPGPPPADLAPGPVTWRLPADLGRRYAAVSGDRNPIHLNPVLARALGFPRTIAHGMWTAARALAAVENRLPPRVRYDVSFGAPVLLPSTVRLALRAGDAPGRALLAVVGAGGRTHLTGVVDEVPPAS